MWSIRNTIKMSKNDRKTYTHISKINMNEKKARDTNLRI